MAIIEKREMMKILGRKTEGNGQLERSSRRWKHNTETELKGIEAERMFIWC